MKKSVLLLCLALSALIVFPAGAKKKKEENAPVQELFSRFGEFDSVEELNKAADGQLAEGDMEALKALAEENGIDDDTVSDYINGYTKELAVPIIAAAGRIKVERDTFKGLKNTRAQAPCIAIAAMVDSMIVNLEFAKNVMKKGKRIKRIADLMYQENCFMGTDQELEDIIRAYYQNGEGGAKGAIAVIRGITERYNGQGAV